MALAAMAEHSRVLPVKVSHTMLSSQPLPSHISAVKKYSSPSSSDFGESSQNPVSFCIRAPMISFDAIQCKQLDSLFLAESSIWKGKLCFLVISRASDS